MTVPIQFVPKALPEHVRTLVASVGTISSSEFQKRTQLLPEAERMMVIRTLTTLLNKSTKLKKQSIRKGRDARVFIATVITEALLGPDDADVVWSALKARTHKQQDPKGSGAFSNTLLSLLADEQEAGRITLRGSLAKRAPSRSAK